MPSKKRQAAGDVERAEVARQAEQRRLAEEQERLRRLEGEARRRLEEEWGRVVAEQRGRALDLQRAITERELRGAYEAQAQQLQEALEASHCEVRELRAKLSGMQQGVAAMQQERESALRRLAMLGNELELAQMKHLESEAMLEHKEREAQRRLHEVERARDSAIDAHRETKVEQERLKQAYTELKEQFNTLQAAFNSNSEVQLANVHPQSTDAETALLLKVLNEEVEKHRETVRLLQLELDRKGRDDEKGSVLISLLNSQLEASRDENKRLHEVSTDRRRQLEGVQSMLDTERERTKSLYRELDMAIAEATVEKRQLTLEIGVHTTQVTELTKTLENVNAELAEIKAQFEAHRSKAAEREQQDFQVNVSLKGEVEQLKKDLIKVTEELRIAGDDAYTKKALMRAEIESLKTRLQKLQENAEKNERESFETIAVLRATSERLQEEKQTLVRNTDETTRNIRNDLVQICAARDAYKSRIEELQKEKEEGERELMEKLLRVTANHDHLHEELQRLTAHHAAREKKFVEDAIFLNAEKETLKAKVEELTEKLMQRRQEHAQHVQDITEELTLLREKSEKQIAAHKKAHDIAAERAGTAEAEVEILKQKVIDLEEQVKDRRRDRDEIERILKAEARELRVELNAAKRTIERFECALGDASYKSMREANERLLRDLEQQREKVAVLNDTIASMKVESTIMESYKEKMLTEQNEQYAKRIQQQEKLRQMMNPLFYELRSIVEKNGLVGPLRRELDAFDDFTRRARPPAASEKRNSTRPINEKILTNAATAASLKSRSEISENDTNNNIISEDGYPTLPALGNSRQSPREGIMEQKLFTTQKPIHTQANNNNIPGEALPCIN